MPTDLCAVCQAPIFEAEEGVWAAPDGDAQGADAHAHQPARHSAAYSGLSQVLDITRRNGTPHRPRHRAEVAS